MFLFDGTVVYSASDLAAAATCEWALMRKLDAKLGRIAPIVEQEDAMLTRAGRLGDLHEQSTLERLKLQHDFVEFERGAFGDFAEAAAQTEAVMKGGARAVFQAAFFDGRLLGYADFIIRNDAGLWEVYDSKLARKAKITALLQLAAYSDQLHRLGIPTGADVHLILGDQKVSTHSLRDILPVYLRRRERLQFVIDEKHADAAPTEWGDPRYAACGRCSVCAPEVEARHDVLLVAGMQLSQRRRLNAAGITTIEQLADRSAPVDKMPASTLASLRAQAAVQVASSPGHPLAVVVFDPSGLHALPAPDPGDIFFDFEGDPLYSEAGGPEWGLDYLFGLVERDETFRAFWAHSYAEEKTALIDFLAYVKRRRFEHPGLHIYHYASYERTHLLSLAARHGVGEAEVDELLSSGVLVDLYPVVRRSTRVGSHSYSIKKLEPLYMGTQLREGVKDAATSITEYVEARQQQEAGDLLGGQARLDAIADYNRYDCVSTLRLLGWLRGLAESNGIPVAADDELAFVLPVPPEPSEVYLKLAAHVRDVAPGTRTPDDTAIALASAAIDYHRRERKKFWQDHFDRLRNPIDDWEFTRGVVRLPGPVELIRGWSKRDRDRAESREYRFRGGVAPGSSLKPGDRFFAVFDPPFPPHQEPVQPGSRFAAERVEVLSVDGDVVVVIEKVAVGAPTYSELPLALTPPSPPTTTNQVQAIEEWGREVLDSLPGMATDAALDILRRLPPRGTLAAVRQTADGHPDFVGAIRDSLLTIDCSYLAVQGPPGTGKTYTGSQVIADLVRNHGWKVGIVAQSHETVKNMLYAIVGAGLDPHHIAKRPKAGDTETVPWQTLKNDTASFVLRTGGWVLGGTEWTFSNANTVLRDQLDLLVIDEAGQFSLASTIASAVSARRVLLLGDPQQLPQVSQGAHPEPVDVSALGWLSEGHDVLPARFGYFLAKTWRMHPALCAPVSRLSYEGRLESQAADRSLEGVAPGLQVVPIVHEGDVTSSIEEADAVVGLVKAHLGRRWVAPAWDRALEQDDIIVVAPYNAQVELIREQLDAAGLRGVPVGTVDRFQGREAAIAIVSLAASSAEDVPRGLEFLLLANRLNVAISRAQWAAYLVYSPSLTEVLPTSVVGLAQLSAFLELVGAGPGTGA